MHIKLVYNFQRICLVLAVTIYVFSSHICACVSVCSSNYLQVISSNANVVPSSVPTEKWIFAVGKWAQKPLGHKLCIVRFEGVFTHINISTETIFWCSQSVGWTIRPSIRPSVRRCETFKWTKINWNKHKMLMDSLPVKPSGENERFASMFW